jgi:hypothetical protein
MPRALLTSIELHMAKYAARISINWPACLNLNQLPRQYGTKNNEPVVCNRTRRSLAVDMQLTYICSNSQAAEPADPL